MNRRCKMRIHLLFKTHRCEHNQHTCTLHTGCPAVCCIATAVRSGREREPVHCSLPVSHALFRGLLSVLLDLQAPKPVRYASVVHLSPFAPHSLLFSFHASSITHFSSIISSLPQKKSSYTYTHILLITPHVHLCTAGVRPTSPSRSTVKRLELASLLLFRAIPHAAVTVLVATSISAFPSFAYYALALLGMGGMNYLNAHKFMKANAAKLHAA